MNNINAFDLEAKVPNPDAETYVVNTSSWCDPRQQKAAADPRDATVASVVAC